VSGGVRGCSECGFASETAEVELEVDEYKPLPLPLCVIVRPASWRNGPPSGSELKMNSGMLWMPILRIVSPYDAHTSL